MPICDSCGAEILSGDIVWPIRAGTGCQNCWEAESDREWWRLMGAEPRPRGRGGGMRLICYYCGKSVSSELPEDAVVRALCACPECIQDGRVPDDGKPTYVGDVLLGNEPKKTTSPSRG